MGWWSTCIMGGDTPYDVAGLVGDKLGGLDYLHMPEDFDDTQRSVVFSALEKYGGSSKLLADVIKEQYSDKWSEGDDHSIVAQVVGLIAISAGVALTEEDKALFIGHIQQDEWAKEDERRKRNIDSLIAAIEAYDGTPVKMDQEGLFEVMAKKLSQDEC